MTLLFETRSRIKSIKGEDVAFHLNLTLMMEQSFLKMKPNNIV